MIRVEIIDARPREHRSRWLDLAPGATVAEALALAAIDAPVAIFGERVTPSRVLEDGDRVEVLRPLVADPKDARRRRAGGNAR